MRPKSYTFIMLAWWQRLCIHRPVIWMCWWKTWSHFFFIFSACWPDNKYLFSFVFLCVSGHRLEKRKRKKEVTHNECEGKWRWSHRPFFAITLWVTLQHNFFFLSKPTSLRKEKEKVLIGLGHKEKWNYSAAAFSFSSFFFWDPGSLFFLYLPGFHRKRNKRKGRWERLHGGSRMLVMEWLSNGHRRVRSHPIFGSYLLEAVLDPP